MRQWFTTSVPGNNNERKAHPTQMGRRRASLPLPSFIRTIPSASELLQCSAPNSCRAVETTTPLAGCVPPGMASSGAFTADRELGCQQPSPHPAPKVTYLVIVKSIAITWRAVKYDGTLAQGNRSITAIPGGGSLTQRVDDVLCVCGHVRRVFGDNVLARLRLDSAYEGFQIVDRYI